MEKNTMIIGFVVDNSASLVSEAQQYFYQAFNEFISKLDKSFVKYAITTFNDFGPKVIKSYDDINYDVAQLKRNKMPYLGKALTKSFDVQKSYLELNRKFQLKPWQVILTTGRTYDEIDGALNVIKEKSSYDFFLLPIALNKLDLSDYYDNVRKAIKKPITLTNENFDKLFSWLESMINKRLNTPVETGIKLNRDDLEGWAYI